jgi:hypothetical protein
LINVDIITKNWILTAEVWSGLMRLIWAEIHIGKQAKLSLMTEIFDNFMKLQGLHAANSGNREPKDDLSLLIFVTSGPRAPDVV